MALEKYQPLRYSHLCSVCNHPLCQVIDGMRAAKYTIAKILEFVEKNNWKVSEQMLKYHWQKHTNYYFPRKNNPHLTQEVRKYIDEQVNPQDTAQFALGVVDQKIKKGDLEPRTWHDAMETVKVAKDTITSQDSSKFYLNQLIQISVGDDTASDNQRSKE